MYFRSSYPDRKEGEEEMDQAEISDDKNLEYDDERLELTLPSGASTLHLYRVNKCLLNTDENMSHHIFNITNVNK